MHGPDPARILIIKPSSLGDIVHALPVLAALRAAHPQAHIAWLVGSSFAPLLDGHPLLDEIIPFDRRYYGRMLQRPRALADFARFLRGLRRRRFDLVLDLQGLLRSGFLALATGARRRIGFAHARELAWLFYTGHVRVEPRHRHAVDRNLRIAQALGLPTAAPAFPLGLRPEECAAARTLLEAAAGRRLPDFVAVLPGARWPTKQWRADRLAALLDRLHADGHPPAVLLGGPDDVPLAGQIAAAAQSRPLNLVGRTTLRELAALLALAGLVLCVDSGPMHIAAALDRPLVALFGPTNPARTGPYSRRARVVALPLPCAPCHRRRCPLGHHRCMQDLDLETVLRNVREVAGRAPARAEAGRGRSAAPPAPVAG